MTTTISGTSGVSKTAPGSVVPESLVQPWPGFTKSYTSSEKDIVSAGSFSVSHGFGTIPELVTFQLICKEADQGYSVGDVLEGVGFYSTAGSTFSRGVAFVCNAESIFCRFGAHSNVFGHLNKSSGAFESFVNSRWKLILRAWA